MKYISIRHLHNVCVYILDIIMYMRNCSTITFKITYSILLTACYFVFIYTYICIIFIFYLYIYCTFEKSQSLTNSSISIIMHFTKSNYHKY